MADPARAKKIADRIKVLVAETLEYRVKDERLGFITITDVRVTGDLQNASVFYTVFGGEAERAETALALESAKGKLRSAVGKASASGSLRPWSSSPTRCLMARPTSRGCFSQPSSRTLPWRRPGLARRMPVTPTRTRSRSTTTRTMLRLRTGLRTGLTLTLSSRATTAAKMTSPAHDHP